MKYTLIAIIIGLLMGCERGDRQRRIDIPNFDFTTSIEFKDSLSSYGIYSDTGALLTPNADYELLELSSVLYTDYAHKQRLVKIPSGTQITKATDGTLEFPDSTIIVKTFYYYNDERDTSKGINIIETRLLIKKDNIWNIATYQWNDSTTEALLKTESVDLTVNWTDAQGLDQSTVYHIPSQNECMTCHQNNSEVTTIGPSIRNLNRKVIRAGTEVDQITYLQLVGILEEFPISTEPTIIDYKDGTYSLEQRARAYLDMNCAHCHQPNAWNESAEQDFDFRYETALSATGILSERQSIIRNLTNGDMPFIGTTMPDKEGIDLVIEYIEGLD